MNFSVTRQAFSFFYREKKNNFAPCGKLVAEALQKMNELRLFYDRSDVEEELYPISNKFTIKNQLLRSW